MPDNQTLLPCVPDNKTLSLYAAVIAIAAALVHLLPTSCPRAAPPVGQTVDPAWGIVQGSHLVPQAGGSVVLEATPQMGRHRVMKQIDIPAPGRYRLSVDTAYDRSSNLMIEIGGPHQNHGTVVLDIKTGTITSTTGRIAGAGVEVLSAADRKYRWHVDFDFARGAASYDFDLLTIRGETDFSGFGECRAILGKPTLAALAP